MYIYISVQPQAAVARVRDHQTTRDSRINTPKDRPPYVQLTSLVEEVPEDLRPSLTRQVEIGATGASNYPAEGVYRRGAAKAMVEIFTAEREVTWKLHLTSPYGLKAAKRMFEDIRAGKLTPVAPFVSANGAKMPQEQVVRAKLKELLDEEGLIGQPRFLVCDVATALGFKLPIFD